MDVMALSEAGLPAWPITALRLVGVFVCASVFERLVFPGKLVNRNIRRPHKRTQGCGCVWCIKARQQLLKELQETKEM